MDDFENTPADPVVPEYDHLYGWERRACLKRFKFHLAQGVAAHPDRPEVVWDRAVYLGYYGGLQAWGVAIAVSAVPSWIVAGVLHASPLVGPYIAASLLLLLPPTVMCYIRLAQAKKCHPKWRHYKRDMDDTDWSVSIRS